MVSGRYMGELFGMAMAALLGEKGRKYDFTSIDMSNIILDESTARKDVAAIIKEYTGKELTGDDLTDVQQLASTIVVRSARAVTAT